MGLRIGFMCLIAGAVCIHSSFADIQEEAQAVLRVPVDSGALIGVSAAVSQGGQIRWEGGAGYRDRDAGLVADADMVHRIASITKSMTAVAVMQLVEAGDTREQMLIVPTVEKRRLPYASGWMVWESEKYGDYYHNDGGQAGTSTYLAIFPEHQITVAVIGNVARAGGEVSGIAFGLVDLVISDKDSTD